MKNRIKSEKYTEIEVCDYCGEGAYQDDLLKECNRFPILGTIYLHGQCWDNVQSNLRQLLKLKSNNPFINYHTINNPYANYQ